MPVHKTPDKNDAIATGWVKCRVCIITGAKNPDMMRKGMNAHLKKHRRPDDSVYNMRQYIAQFGPDAEDDFWFNHSAEATREKFVEAQARMKETRRKEKSGDFSGMEPSAYSELEESEKDRYKQEFEKLADAVDRDQVHIHAIHGICLSQAYLDRLYLSVMKSSHKGNNHKFVPNKDQEKTIQDVEKRILESRKSLGLDRASNLNRGNSIKSTPSMIISAYVDEIRKMTPQVLDAYLAEERKCRASIAHNIKDLLAAAGGMTEEEKDASQGAFIPLSREEVARLAKSGIRPNAQKSSLESTEG